MRDTGRLDYVASVYVVREKCVLLVDHPTLGLWLPPGGHIEENETPSECAIREAMEETGIQIEIVSNETEAFSGSHDGEPIRLLHLPITIQRERIEAGHYHVNFVFAGRPVGRARSTGTYDARWVPLAELRAPESENVLANALRAAEILRADARDSSLPSR